MFNKYCIKASNLEIESKFNDAIISFKKAREINQNGEFEGIKLTERIIDLQDKIIERLISKGKDELENNLRKSLEKNLDKQKELSFSINKTSKIKALG